LTVEAHQEIHAPPRSSEQRLPIDERTELFGARVPRDLHRQRA